MQTLTQIREMLEECGLSPRKSFGQNFLIDHNHIRSLVDSSGVGKGDLVLEVGPGTGALTDELLGRGCEVIACEIDRGLAALNRDRLGDNTHFTLIEGDCLKSKREVSPEIVDAVRARRFTLVANLPYGAATPLMIDLLIGHPMCQSMFVTIQREVAQRLAACAGNKHYGTLSVIAQALAQTQTLAKLPPECFWPRPDVTSAMVAVTRRANPLTDRPAELSDFCLRLFGARRKQLGTTLGRDVPFPAGITPQMRAEQLEPAQIVDLFAAIEPA